MAEIPTQAILGVADDFVPAARNAMRSGKNVTSQPQAEDWVDIAERNMFSMKVQGPMFLGPMLLGPMAGFAAKLKMPWLERNLLATKNLTFRQVGNATGLGGIFGGISNGVMGALGYAVKPFEALGLTGVAGNFYAKQLARHTSEIDKAMKVISAHSAQVSHPELAAALQGVESHLAAGLPTMRFSEELGASVKSAHAALASAGHMPGILAGFIGGSGGGASKELSRALKTVANSTYKAELAADFARGYSNLSEVTRNATPHMAQANVWHGLLQGTFVVGAAASDYHTVKDLRKGLQAMKDMYCGLTGEKADDISAFSLFIGKVPAPVAAARAELLKEFGPAAVLDVANTVLNVKGVVHNKYFGLGKNMLLLIALPMANSIIARGLLGGTLLPAYMKIKESEAAHQPVAQEDYIKLIANASKDLQVLGGETSNFTKALAFFYAQHQAKADMVLKEIDNGTLRKRMEEMEREYNAYIREHPGHDPKNRAKANGAAVTHSANGHNHHEAPANGVSHAGQPHSARPERKIVGPETKKLIERSVAEGMRESPVI